MCTLKNGWEAKALTMASDRRKEERNEENDFLAFVVVNPIGLGFRLLLSFDLSGDNVGGNQNLW